MRKVDRKIVFVALLPLALGACQSFLGIRFASARPKPAMAAAAPQVRAAMTAEGRRLLDEGNTGAAVEAFQRALVGGEPVAPAYNGLGVAYARLGRFDLAQRFFESAASADDGNPRYRENLARLMRSPAFAMRRDADLLARTLASEAAAQAAAQPAMAARGQIQRVSRGEVRIETVAPQAAPLRNAALAARFKPAVRIEFADQPKQPAFQPLVRIELPAAAPADGTPPKAPDSRSAARP